MLPDRLVMAGKLAGRIGLILALAGVWSVDGQVRYRANSKYNQITVEDQGGYRLLRFNGSMETRMWLGNHLRGHFEYTEYFQLPLLWNPNAKRVMIMGLGGGSAQRAFAAYYPDIHVDTVELDPMVVQVATDRRYFNVQQNAKHKIHVGDGRQFIRVNKAIKYDAIAMDAYTSNKYGSHIPHHLATKEFFQLVSSRLTDNGVLAYNVIGSYQNFRADIVGSMYNTIKSVFPHVYHFPASDSKNVVILGVKSKQGLTNVSLKAKVTALRKARKLPAHFGPRLKRIRAQAPPSAAKSPVLTDNFAPTNGLLMPKR